MSSGGARNKELYFDGGNTLPSCGTNSASSKRRAASISTNNLLGLSPLSRSTPNQAIDTSLFDEPNSLVSNDALSVSNLPALNEPPSKCIQNNRILLETDTPLTLPSLNTQPSSEEANKAHQPVNSPSIHDNTTVNLFPINLVFVLLCPRNCFALNTLIALQTNSMCTIWTQVLFA